MWQPDAKDVFIDCIDDLLEDWQVQSMSNIKQHINGVSCFDHSLFVAYISFRICKTLNLNFRSAARAGLLHDLYLCDWNAANVGRWERLLIHPQMALENADRFDLSVLEKDIIEKHMWPVTLRLLPRHRESFVVNFADKLCATAEVLHIYHLFRRKNALQLFAIPKTAAAQAQ